MKALKIIGIIIGVFVLLIIAATIAAKIIFTKEKILAMAIPKIEEAIHRKVAIKDASLSIFPNISVNLDSLVIQNRSGYQQENLLSLDEFSVKLKLLPLLRKKIELKKLVFNRPNIYLEKSGEKESNYQDFLQTDKERKIVPITFDRMEIRGGRIVFYNRPKQSTLVLEQLNQEGELKLVEDRILVTKGKLSIGNIQLKNKEGGLSYPLELEYSASYDLIFDSLKVDQAEIKFAKLRLDAQAKVEDLTLKPKLDLKLKAEECLAADLLALLPESQKKLADKWKISGKMSLQAEGTWDFSQGLRPNQLDGEISGKQIELVVKENLPKVSIPLLTADLSEKNVTITTSQASIGDAPLLLKVVIENPEDLNLSGEFSSKFELALLPQFIQMPAGTQLSGQADISTSFFGELKSVRDLNLAGNCNLSRVNISAPSLAQPISNLNAALKLTQGELVVENLSANQGKSNFALNGSCKGLVPYLLAKKEEKEKFKPTLDFNFTSNYLNLDEILPVGDTSKAKSDTAQSKPLYLGLGSLLNLQGKLKIDKAVFRQVEVSNFQGDLSLIDGVLKLTNVSTNVYSGSANGEAVCDLRDPQNVKFDLRVQSQGMEANNFLSRFSRVQNHLYGKLNFEGNFSGQGNSVPQIQNSLAGEGKASFTEGKLTNWDFANKMTGFLNLKQFEEEPIKELKNKFAIKGARLYFEDFLATSKKADWKLDGSIGLLDQSLDYSLNILLSPEVSSQVNILGEQTKLLMDEQGRLLIPLKISGLASSPKFAIDLSLVGQKLQNQLKQNLQEKKSEVKEDLQKKAKEALEGLFKKKKDG